MDILKLDWNEAWKELSNKRNKYRSSSFWDKRAESFAKHVRQDVYGKKFVQLLKPSLSWSVLDIGCGPGTIALLLAKKVKHITAIDISNKMLEILQKRAEEQNIKNITPLRVGWEDNWKEKGIGVYDVSIASRSLIVEDLKEAIEKINKHTRKKVFLSWKVGDGPFIRNMYEYVRGNLSTGPDYIYIYNFLYQIGIYPNVVILEHIRDEVFSSLEDAVKGYSWMFDDITIEEENRLRDYLRKNLIKSKKGWKLRYPHIVRWAVIWYKLS